LFRHLVVVYSSYGARGGGSNGIVRVLRCSSIAIRCLSSRSLLVAGLSEKRIANDAPFVRGAENSAIRDIFPTCSLWSANIAVGFWEPYWPAWLCDCFSSSVSP